MATSVGICSAALLQLGKSPINDFEEDTDLARLCSNLYPIERDALLRENDWNCATRRVVLALLAEGPAFGFGAQFALPGDFLRLKSVGDQLIGSPNCMAFRIEGQRILASGTTLAPVYIWRNDQEASWDSKLVELMTARMLWKLAYPVTASTSLRDELKTEYQAMVRVARAIDSQENPSDALSDEYSLLTGREARA